MHKKAQYYVRYEVHGMIQHRVERGVRTQVLDCWPKVQAPAYRLQRQVVAPVRDQIREDYA